MTNNIINFPKSQRIIEMEEREKVAEKFCQEQNKKTEEMANILGQRLLVLGDERIFVMEDESKNYEVVIGIRKKRKQKTLKQQLLSKEFLPFWFIFLASIIELVLLLKNFL